MGKPNSISFKRVSKLCAICISSISFLHKTRKLGCNHIFHKNCIDAVIVRWNRKCPLCMADILSSKEQSLLRDPKIGLDNILTSSTPSRANESIDPTTLFLLALRTDNNPLVESLTRCFSPVNILFDIVCGNLNDTSVPTDSDWFSKLSLSPLINWHTTRNGSNILDEAIRNGRLDLANTIIERTGWRRQPFLIPTAPDINEY